MAKALVSEVGRVSFELDRFALVGGEACEVQGRWFGVRGRRFMRPALTVVVDGRPVRLLADLAHKPWAAEDGEPWQAVFPCVPDGAEVEEAELTVGPDVTIALPAPDGQRPGPRRRSSGRPDPRRPARRPEPTRARRHRAGAQPPAPLTEELGQERAARQRLERELQRAEADLTQAQERVARLEGEMAQLAGQRDTARADRRRIQTVCEGLQRECDRAAQARDTALEAQRAAEAGAGQAHRERAEALQAVEAAGERAAAGREGALALRDHAIAERDAAVAARQDAVAQRDALARTSERLQGELSELLSARGAALVMRRAAQDRASRPYALLIPRAMGGFLILVIVVVSLLLLHVL